jgi:hypothetical protein
VATNRVYKEGEQLSVAPTDPQTAAIASGGPIRLGVRNGIALTKPGVAGNAAGKCTVDFGNAVWTLAVQAINAAVNVGDALWYHDGGVNAPTITNVVAAGYFFGVAMEAMNTNTNAIIQVAHVDTARPVGT